MMRFLKFVGLVLLAAVVVIAVIAGCFRPGILRGTPNDGHQLGGDLLKDIPGNTLEAFEAAITSFESKPTYSYSECDVRETKDNRLVVFHDWDISKVPDTQANRDALGEPVGKQAVCELTLQQLQGLRLKGGCSIPTLEEVLKKATKLKLEKPLLLEIKYIHSDYGRHQLLRSAKLFRDESGIEVHFLAFIRNVSRSFPEPKKWLREFSQNGFRVYQVYRPKTKENDLCETWE